MSTSLHSRVLVLAPLLTLACLAFPAARALADEGTPRRVAVLTLTTDTGIPQDKQEYLSETTRGAVRASLATDQWSVVHKQQMQALLEANAGDLAYCVDMCELEIGRLLQVEMVVAGNIVRFDDEYRLLLSLFHIPDQDLKSTEEVRSQDLGDLADLIQPAVARLFGLDRVDPPGLTAGQIHIPGTRPPERSIVAERHVVEFVSSPGNAIVYVDGTELCNTECSRSLSAEPHRIVFEHDRYEAAERVVDVQGPQVVSQELTPLFGLLTVTSEPRGIPVTLDGQELGPTPITRLEKDPGTYRVQIADPAWVDDAVEVTVAAAHEEKIAFTGTPVLGVVEVEVRDHEGNDLSRDVLVDGTRVGKSPRTLELQVGLHEVRVGEGRRSVSVKAEASQNVSFVESPTLRINNNGPTAAGSADQNVTRVLDEEVVRRTRQLRVTGTLMMILGGVGTATGFGLHHATYTQGREIRSDLNAPYPAQDADLYHDNLDRYASLRTGNKVSLALGIGAAGTTLAGLILLSIPDPTVPMETRILRHRQRQQVGTVAMIAAGLPTLVGVAGVLGEADEGWIALLVASGATAVTGFVVAVIPVPQATATTSSHLRRRPTWTLVPGPVTTLTVRF